MRKKQRNFIKVLAVPMKESHVIKGYSVYVPYVWKHFIEQHKHYKVPVVSLHDTMQMLLMDLLFVNNRAFFNPNEPWLFSRHPVDLDLLKHIIESWYIVHFHKPLPPDVLSGMEMKEEERVANIVINEQGTADLSDGFAYQYVPKIISVKLNKNLFIPSLGKHLHFVDVCVPLSQGAEWISWPPEQVTIRKKREYFSYKVTFKMQTIPFESVPYLYIYVSAVRWMAHKASLRETGATVYLQGTYPWISGIADVAPMVKASVKKRNGHLRWKHQANDVLQEMGYGRLLPEIEAVFDNPRLHLEGEKNHEFNTFIPYGTHLWGTHPIGAGAGFQERIEIAKAIAQQLSNVDPFPVCQRIQSSSKNRKKTQLKLPPAMTIEIWYSDAEWLAKVKETLFQSLDIEAPNEQNVYAYGSSKIIVKERAITESLDIESNEANGKKLLVQRIGKMLNNDASPAFCFFELKDKDEFRHSIDPKDFIRHMFVNHNKWTQFIRPIDPAEDDTTSENRFKRAVEDLFRQAGVVSRRGQAVLERHENTAFIGLYNIQRNKRTSQKQIDYPIMVQVDANEIKMALPHKGWMPYHEGLLMLAKESDRLPEQEVNTFLCGALQQVQADHIVLFAEAQNIRGSTKWFQNKHIHTSVHPFALFRNVSIVRLRDEEGGETPEWTVFDSIDEYSEMTEIASSFPTGVFQFNDRVFFNIGSKPKGVGQGINPKKTKLQQPNKNLPRSTAVELTIPICAEGQSPETLALLTYELRNQTSLQYDDMDTLMPLPLHLAQKAKEYAKMVL
ncbi:hypothetical protein HNQ34_003138 [Anoxybacillus tepidamans]|uniref:DUF3893 domain-containing protein n=1 Tax=Anoxybacteroides tepidamans TaxID=265948 RepID=A0A7W8ISP3_9BACL|nr:DUF3962 domain-containing protein [Anoxybacillus tepidamans]MBB5326020.1 hypothetical protein [Anoxybacillus tepidamans]